MGIISTEVEIKINPNNVEYYKNLGYKIPIKKASDSYFKKYKKEYSYDFSRTIIVKLEDLQNGSNSIVRVRCDLCNKNEMDVCYNIYNRVVKKTGNYVCRECSVKKQEQTMVKKYGVKNASQSKIFKEKREQTILSRYGVKNYGETKEHFDKIKQISLEKFNVEHFAKSPIVKKKKIETFYNNGTISTSKQQLYLYNVYKRVYPSAQLNYPISHYSADICFPEEKIDFEVDFGGHNLPVKTGKLTQEEFNQKEIVRNNIIKREGYKMIRLISSKDFLPSDEILLQLLSHSKEYFSNYPNRSWIEFNIDTSTVRNAEHGEVFFNFDQLRRIKKSDLPDKTTILETA